MFNTAFVTQNEKIVTFDTGFHSIGVRTSDILSTRVVWNAFRASKAETGQNVDFILKPVETSSRLQLQLKMRR